MKKWLIILTVLLFSNELTVQAESIYSIKHKDQVKPEFEIHVDYPLFNGIKNKRLQEDVNENVKETIDEVVREVEKLGDQSNGFPVLYYEEFTVAENKGLCSVVMTAHISQGNKHDSRVRSLNFQNDENGIFLELKDVVDLSKLNIEVNKIISNDPESFNTQQFTGVRDNTAFYIKDGELFLIFNKYEIAPGVFGTPEISIPFSKVKRELPQHKKAVPVPKEV
ncbi:RsiV family protein [Halobacillus massiliensis]|uniref:RsiV family protein n=1 Tax=Halobacillus massiliensis TaxID=1926286 RepID=UPI001FE6521D|nr:RsiV family protein [Halobacillus massiliensis]